MLTSSFDRAELLGDGPIAPHASELEASKTRAKDDPSTRAQVHWADEISSSLHLGLDEKHTGGDYLSVSTWLAATTPR